LTKNIFLCLPRSELATNRDWPHQAEFILIGEKSVKLRNYLGQLFIASILAFTGLTQSGAGQSLAALHSNISGQETTKVEKKPLPPVNWSRSRKADVKHIAIELRFDWVKKQAYGVTSVTLAPLNPTSKIMLDAAYLTINAVTSQNGTPLKFEYEGSDKNDNFRITLERVYQAGEDITININYRTNWVSTTDPNSLSGSNGKGLHFFEPTSNDLNRTREIWSMGDPEFNRYWFPSYDSPNDLRTTEFTATVDQPLTAISNGELMEVRNNPDGSRTFHWKTDSAHANASTSFVIGDYVDVPQTYEGIKLHNFGYRNETDAVAATVVRLPDMVKFYSDRTGVKFPYPSYSQVFVQEIPWGLGTNGLAIQSENMIDDDRIHADFFYLWDGLEAEALAQQWFGNYLSARDWSHVWLNRGFAHYFDGLYNEHKNGHEEFLLWNLLGDHATYLGDWASGMRHPIVTRNYGDRAAFTGDNYSYSRAASVLHMLRKHLGEENWWRAIQLYVRANGNQSVSTEDFRRAVEAASGEPMDWFFDQWLYKMGHPIFEVTRNYDAAKSQFILNVRQTQKVDANDEYPQVEFFAGKVAVEIDSRIEEIWLEPKAENVFVFASEQPPKLVNFDYESTWIKEIKFQKSLAELLYQLQADQDVLGRRWAMGELSNLARDAKTSAGDKAKIYAGLRNTILSNSYWRLRQSAIGQLQSLLAPFTETKPVPLDEATVSLLLTIIEKDRSWTRAAAINFLGMTRDEKFTGLYLKALSDQSDRVIAAAATALGKTKSPKAFAALTKLANKPSWKNQSLMNSLIGLKELGDPRGVEIALKALADPQLHRWRLPTPPVWDLRVIAVDTLITLGKGDAAYPVILERFRKSMAEDDVSGIFNNLLLIAKLADPRGKEVFEPLRTKFKDDVNAMSAVNQYETQFVEALKKKG
jgi:aminopeptidase N